MLTNPIVFASAHGFLDAYRAYCCYYDCEPSIEFIHHVERTMLQASFELDLTSCPGIEAKSDLSFSLVPVMAALKYNTYAQLSFHSNHSGIFAVL